MPKLKELTFRIFIALALTTLRFASSSTYSFAEEVGECQNVAEFGDEELIVVLGETSKRSHDGTNNVILVAETGDTEKGKPKLSPHPECPAHKVKNGDVASNGIPCIQGLACTAPGKRCGPPGIDGHCRTVGVNGQCDCKCVN